jgi:hypothetical protein
MGECRLGSTEVTMQPHDAQSELDTQWEAFSQFPVVVDRAPQVVQPPAPARPAQPAYWPVETVRFLLSTLAATIRRLSREMLNVGRVAQAINAVILAGFLTVLIASARLPFGMPATREVISQHVAILLTMFAVFGGPFLLLFAVSWVAAHDGPRSVSAVLALIGTISVALCTYGWVRLPRGGLETVFDLLFWLAMSYFVAIAFSFVTCLAAALRRAAAARA